MELDFLSPDAAIAHDGSLPAMASPLRRALAHGGAHLADLSGLGKAEVRGELSDADVPPGAEALRIASRRHLVISAYEDGARVRAHLASPGRLVVDQTGALAGLAVRGERLMRRLTDLDLTALPAAGMVAQAPAVLARGPGEEEYRLFVPQELGHHLVEVVLDAEQGL